MLTRTELLAPGWSDDAIHHAVSAGRWVRAARGAVVVAAVEGQLGRIRPAATLGGEAAVIGGAAAYLLGITPDPPSVIDVLVPHGRCPRPRDGVRYRHRRRMPPFRTLAGIPVSGAEETVLDLADWAGRDDDALAWLFAATNGRLTTPQRDNHNTLAGRRTLRFGWLVVSKTPCAMAGQVAAALALGGWQGTARRCGAACGLDAPRR